MPTSTPRNHIINFNMVKEDTRPRVRTRLLRNEDHNWQQLTAAEVSSPSTILCIYLVF